MFGKTETRSSPYEHVGGFKEGDWVCDSCGNHNFASRTTCNARNCGLPASRLAGSSSFFYGGAGKGAMSNPFALKGGKAKGMVAGVGPGNAAGSSPSAKKFMDGDWICMTCGNHNFASRSHCNAHECGAPSVSSLMSTMFGGSGGMQGGSGGKCAGKGSGGMQLGGGGKSVGKSFGGMQQAYGGKSVGRKPDGMELGYGGKSVGTSSRGMQEGYGGKGCGKGGIGKSSLVSPTDVKEGDWECHICGNHNFASRVKCNARNCEALRDGMKAGDWVCRKCKNHNFASRDTCNANMCDERRAADQ